MTTPPEAAGTGADLVVVANRLPVRGIEEDGRRVWITSPGGVVSALVPALRDGHGLWIGWAGDAGEGEAPPSEHEGIALRDVAITEDEYDEYYLGFANATLWPLYHDAIRPATFARSWWHAYATVNERFAVAAAEGAAPGATVWVQDYQLQLVPKLLRERRPDLNIGFFLHIPFPPRELFLQLPWRREILDGLLGADLVGFQVPGGATNFTRLARQLAGVGGTAGTIDIDGRRVRVGTFPISVDNTTFAARASDPDVQARARQIRTELGDPDVLLLGVDRLDYTKGIDRRLRAIGELFDDGRIDPPRPAPCARSASCSTTAHSTPRVTSSCRSPSPAARRTPTTSASASSSSGS